MNHQNHGQTCFTVPASLCSQFHCWFFRSLHASTSRSHHQMSWTMYVLVHCYSSSIPCFYRLQKLWKAQLQWSTFLISYWYETRSICSHLRRHFLVSCHLCPSSLWLMMESDGCLLGRLIWGISGSSCKVWGSTRED